MVQYSFKPFYCRYSNAIRNCETKSRQTRPSGPQKQLAHLQEVVSFHQTEGLESAYGIWVQRGKCGGAYGIRLAGKGGPELHRSGSQGEPQAGSAAVLQTGAFMARARVDIPKAGRKSSLNTGILYVLSASGACNSQDAVTTSGR